MNGTSPYLNRDLSWLEFDRRVLAMAQDTERPLLERVKFLAIFSRNLDEFFQVRVAGLQDAAGLGGNARSLDGLSPAEQLVRIHERVDELTRESQDLWSGQLQPALAAAGVEVLPWAQIGGADREQLAGVFRERIQPVLVPLCVDPSHPFPYISDLSLSVAALLRARRDGPELFARVKVPPRLGRWWALRPGCFVALEEIVEAHLEELFPDHEILQRGHFRVTRDADLEVRQGRLDDLAEAIEQGLRRRHRGSDAVRLEADAQLGPQIRELLLEELALEAGEVYDATGLLDLGGLWELYRLDRPDLKDEAWSPRPTFEKGQDPDRFFEDLRARPRLVHHPYESFEASVETFLRTAADDPNVHVIMATIYRTGGPETGIVRALEAAALRGKQVVVLVELQARFDEAQNLERARALERAGAHVVYGLVGLKTHAKLALVVRAESGIFRRYCHVGTGNYNPETARLYEDLGLLTGDGALTSDVAELFHRLTSNSGGRSYQRLLVAPEHLRAGLLERIEREARAPDGRIAVKVNNLSDPAIIDALYDASRGGTEIDLVVRSVCCLRPGASGLSERIRVRSVLGRFLEHSRIFRFGSEERGREYWIGSADMMPRNLDLRVEALAPVEDPALTARLDRILELLLDPAVRAWELDATGTWKQTGGTLDAQAEMRRDLPSDAHLLLPRSAREPDPGVRRP